MPQEKKQQKKKQTTPSKKKKQRYKVINLKSTNGWKKPTQKELNRLKDDPDTISSWDWYRI